MSIYDSKKYQGKNILTRVIGCVRGHSQDGVLKLAGKD